MTSNTTPSLFEKPSAKLAPKVRVQNEYTALKGRVECPPETNHQRPVIKAIKKSVQVVSTTINAPAGYTIPSGENETYLTAIQVAQRLSIGKATVWRWTKYNEDFPNPIRFSKKATRWRLSDLIAFEAHALMEAPSKQTSGCKTKNSAQAHLIYTTNDILELLDIAPNTLTA